MKILDVDALAKAIHGFSTRPSARETWFAKVAELSAQPQLVLAFALAAAAGSVGAHFLDKTVNHLRGK